jgi:hypothetical protein
MAVIGRRGYIALLTTGLFYPVWVRADQPSDLRDILQQIATSLTDENAADALKPFSRAFNNYDKLRDDFDGLTASYQVTNEVNVLDEQDDSDQITATVGWTITLGNKSNLGVQDSRHREIHLRLVREKKHWKIIAFSPFDLFDPQFRTRSGNPPQ